MPANIAEGTKRQGNQDYARFLNIAEGSLAETHYLQHRPKGLVGLGGASSRQLLLSRELGYMDAKVAKRRRDEAGEISRMLFAFRRKVETSKLRRRSHDGRRLRRLLPGTAAERLASATPAATANSHRTSKAPSSGSRITRLLTAAAASCSVVKAASRIG